MRKAHLSTDQVNADQVNADQVNAPLRVYIDVTDTVATSWRAGIQRVVVQVIVALQRDDRLVVEPVVWLESARSFRFLTGDERSALYPSGAVVPVGADPPARPSATATAGAAGAVRPMLGSVRRTLKALLVALRVEPVLRRVRSAVLRRSRDRGLVPLVEELRSGSVLLEMDSVWNNLWVDRAELYGQLHARGVRVAALVHDVLPQEHPEWFEPSLVTVSDRTIRAQVTSADLLLVTSRDGAERLVAWADGERIDGVSPEVVTLGADGLGGSGSDERSLRSTPAGEPEVGEPAVVELPPELRGTRYALSVGSIEPRKNHATLLDAFEQIWRRDPDAHLVLVGKPGWNNDDMIDRLVEHPLAGRSLHWYQGVDDVQLAALYSCARVVAVASLAEGYGLPVIESLAHGVPVVSSDSGALVEAGAGMAEHVRATDAVAWAESLGRMLADDEAVALKREEIAAYAPPGWAGTAERMTQLLVERFGAERTEADCSETT